MLKLHERCDIADALAQRSLRSGKTAHLPQPWCSLRKRPRPLRAHQNERGDGYRNRQACESQPIHALSVTTRRLMLENDKSLWRGQELSSLGSIAKLDEQKAQS